MTCAAASPALEQIPPCRQVKRPNRRSPPLARFCRPTPAGKSIPDLARPRPWLGARCRPDRRAASLDRRAGPQGQRAQAPAAARPPTAASPASCCGSARPAPAIRWTAPSLPSARCRVSCRRPLSPGERRRGRRARRRRLGPRRLPLPSLQERQRQRRGNRRPRAARRHRHCPRAGHRRGGRLGRDLINTPASDLGPAELEAAARQRRRAPRRQPSPASSAMTCSPPNFPMIHAVGRASERAPRLIDMSWGRAERTARHAGRQGHLLRHRRPRHQAGERHADHEEGHGRRRRGPGARPHDHGGQARRAPAHADPGCREQHRRQRLPPRRRAEEPRRQDRGDRQHRRGGPPGAGRCAGARRRGRARHAARASPR